MARSSAEVAAQAVDTDLSAWQGGDPSCEGHIFFSRRCVTTSVTIDTSRPVLAFHGVAFAPPSAPREVVIYAVCICGARSLMGRERYAAGTRQAA